MTGRVLFRPPCARADLLQSQEDDAHGEGLQHVRAAQGREPELAPVPPGWRAHQRRQHTKVARSRGSGPDRLHARTTCVPQAFRSQCFLAQHLTNRACALLQRAAARDFTKTSLSTPGSTRRWSKLYCAGNTLTARAHSAPGIPGYVTSSEPLVVRGPRAQGRRPEGEILQERLDGRRAGDGQPHAGRAAQRTGPPR